MEFKDLNIKNRYRSADTSNIGRDFIEKVLKQIDNNNNKPYNKSIKTNER